MFPPMNIVVTCTKLKPSSRSPFFKQSSIQGFFEATFGLKGPVAGATSRPEQQAISPTHSGIGFIKNINNPCIWSGQCLSPFSTLGTLYCRLGTGRYLSMETCQRLAKKFLLEWNQSISKAEKSRIRETLNLSMCANTKTERNILQYQRYAF